MIYYAKPHEAKYFKNIRQINVTSHGKDQFKQLSPFKLGPVSLYKGYISQNVENAWQFCKVYPEHADAIGNPTAKYFSWSRAGWNSKQPFRYPMGKGKKPLYSYWDGEKLDYITARKRIYIPLYTSAAVKTNSFQELKSIKEDILIVDFDVYDKGVLDWDTLINDSLHPFGHGFVLGMLLEGYL